MLVTMQCLLRSPNFGTNHGMPKIDIDAAPTVTGSRYPGAFAEPCRTRQNRQLGRAAGLTQFGVNLTTLPPGAWSSQRHWHEHEDELVYVLEGEVVLIEDDGEHVLGVGGSAGFKAGVRNGHHFVNRSDRNAVLLTIGTRSDRDFGEYPDIDMKFLPGRYSGGGGHCRKDGTRY
jgi:uncharacterized cupin superfamily protein